MNLKVPCIISILLITVTVPNLFVGDVFASSYEEYSPDKPLKHFEDIFFQRHYSNGEKYSFSVPKFFQNKTLGHDITWDDGYRGYEKPPGNNTDVDPEGENYANITITDQDGRILMTIDNRDTNVGGGSPDSIDLDNVREFHMDTEGSFEVIFCLKKKWGDIFNEPQYISFKGRGIGYNLWGLAPISGVRGYDPQSEYMEFKIEADKPIKAYMFGGAQRDSDYFEGRGDSDEDRSEVKTLEVKDIEISNMPFIVLSTFGDDIQQVNASITLSIRDRNEVSTPTLLAIVSGIILTIVGVTVWVMKKD